MKRDPLMWIGGAFLLLLILTAIFAPFFRPPYDMPHGGKSFQPPSAEFWLGTDEQGRDVFARVAHGARVSLLVGIIVQSISIVLGIIVGVLGVYAPRWVSTPLMRFTDAMFAFPDILLGILIIGILSPGMFPVIAALAVTAWPGIARLVRTQVASVKDREFVIASRAMGASLWFTVTRHVLPQLWGILLAVTMVELAGTILAESTLSFLGIGILPPEPSWGNMIKSGRELMNAHPSLLFWPCLFLSVTIFALNFVGDGIRAAIDPRSRGLSPGGLTIMSRITSKLGGRKGERAGEAV